MSEDDRKPPPKEEIDEDAASALLEISTLSQSVSWETIRELLKRVIQSSRHVNLLPVLICYLRNHGKSLAPGSGLGERSTAERLVIALYEIDPDAAMELVRLLVLYGSWKSLLSILVIVDDLINADTEKEAIAPVRPLRKHRGGDKSDEPKRKSGAREGPYVDLCNRIHELFAKQMKEDLNAVDEAEKNNQNKNEKVDDEGPKTKKAAVARVSNASKFAPHEKRGKDLSSAHGDKVASMIFKDENDNDDAMKDDDTSTNKKVYALRRKYRHARSKLNEHNKHLPDRFLSLGRANELQAKNITAGYMAKSRKALLNLPLKPSATKKQRYDDPGRIELRNRVLEAAADPEKIPAPSSIQELAKSLMNMNDEGAEMEMDAGEKLIVEVTYKKAVMELVKSVRNKETEVQTLLSTLSASDADLTVDQIKAPSQVVVCVDVSKSQSHAFPTKALLALLFVDLMDALANEASDTEDEKMIDTTDRVKQCIVFDQTAQLLDIPSSEGPEENDAAQRLATLVKAFRSVELSSNGEGSDCKTDYSKVVDLLNMIVVDTSAAVVIASDFAGSEDFTSAIEDFKNGEVCCWKMVAPARDRLREVQWDPENPQIDVCFVLDTTGSMSSHIRHCKEEIQSLLSELTKTADMPVACSFVSYKDFGDSRHLETFPWSRADRPDEMSNLVDFIATLGASGGMDWEEDIAGGFETALGLMKERTKRSMKMILLIADAPAHGFPGGRPNHGGVDQRERLKRVTISLASQTEGTGCEIVLAKINSGTDDMCETIDAWLQGHKTFIDQVGVEHSGGMIFREKILSSFQSIVSHAIAPPTAQGIDIYGGTDFGICEILVNSRMSNLAAKLIQSKAKDVQGEEEEYGAKDSGNKVDTDTASEIEDERPTAFSNLAAKLNSSDYNLVREMMGALRSGLFAEYKAPSGQELSHASIGALLQTGLTVQDLQELGYPDYVIDMFQSLVQSKLSDGGATFK